MNQLKRLRLDGYKSIRKMDLKFDNINILIGGNGAGKSNLISFFEMLLNLNQHEFQNFVMEQAGADGLLYNGRKQTNECEFDLQRRNGGLHVRFKATNQDGLYIAKQKWSIDGGNESYFEKDGTVELEGDEKINALGVLDGIGVYHFHDTSKSSPMKASCNINDNITLASDGRNIASMLYRIKATDSRAYSYIVNMVRLVAPYFQDFILRENPVNPERIRLEWKKIGCDIPFGVDQLSDGTLRFICLTTLLCQPEELRKDIICIDEPELGLHPYAITILTEFLKKYAAKRQVIVATQSVDLLDAFSPEDIIVVDNQDGTSLFKRLSGIDLQEWLEEYSIGELWKKNIFGGRP
jgi:predicted ATPase